MIPAMPVLPPPLGKLVWQAAVLIPATVAKLTMFGAVVALLQVMAPPSPMKVALPLGTAVPVAGVTVAVSVTASAIVALVVMAVVVFVSAPMLAANAICV